MTLVEKIKKFWAFLKEDTWQSWIVSLILIIIFIKLIFFPALSFLTGTPLPLVVVESCSMYHKSSFEDWWQSNSNWYENKGVEKSDFESFSLKNGLNKGDIIIIWGRSSYNLGDIIIFLPNKDSTAIHPIIHRIINTNPIATKGDHNSEQLTINNNFQRLDETDISKDRILGKSVARIPYLGWIKLIFFEFSRPENERGFCK